MHIVFHAHRAADVTDALQERAEQSVRKLATRLRGTTDASIRFAGDGATRRVDIVLSVARRAPLVAVGEGARYEAALSAAVERLSAHVAHVRAERGRRRRVPDGLRAQLGVVGPEDDVLDADLGDVALDAAEPPPRRAAGA